ncbi:MAG: TIGR00725 family protein [Thaumarchaeota archaeon]|nr:MAG: TIGR00725 family protein [Nitrososphaerota archaeon]
MHNKSVVAIGASSDPHPFPKAIRKTREFAKTLSKYKDEVVLLTGGDGGLMRIACEEFVKRGGTTIGIIPLEDETIGGEHPRYNPYNTIRIFTGVTYQARSIQIARSCNAMVILGGGAGTIIEAFLAYLYQKPLIALTNTGYPSDRLVIFWEDGYLDHRKITKAYFVEDPVEAAELAYRLVRSRS